MCGAQPQPTGAAPRNETLCCRPLRLRVGCRWRGTAPSLCPEAPAHSHMGLGGKASPRLLWVLAKRPVIPPAQASSRGVGVATTRLRGSHPRVLMRFEASCLTFLPSWGCGCSRKARPGVSHYSCDSRQSPTPSVSGSACGTWNAGTRGLAWLSFAICISQGVPCVC